MLVKEIQKVFMGMNPNDEVWIHYITKDDIKDVFSNCEYTDENDNLIDTDPFVTDDVFQDITTQLDNDEYLWERFSETYNDICRDVLEKLLGQNETETDEVDDESLWKE